jgi:nucleoid-associated protein YgaU
VNTRENTPVNIPTNRPANRLSAAGRAGSAGLLLLALVVGVPLLLAMTIGNPLAAMPGLLAGDVSDTVVIHLLAIVAYIAWAQFALAVVVEAVAVARRTPAPRMPGFAAPQQLAHALVAAALLAAPAMSAISGPPPKAYTAPAVPASSTAVPSTTASGLSASGGYGQRVVTYETAEPEALPITATNAVTGVVSGGTTAMVSIGVDGPGTYWDLAVAYLGDGQRWSEIWTLNQGRHQADGGVMSTPGLLRPGWTVLIPSSDSANVTASEATGETSVVVERGDTLTGVAADHDIDDWEQLWELNRGRTQPGGDRLRDPDHIEPGWVIDLPAKGRHTAPTSSTTPPEPGPGQQAAAEPTPGSSEAESTEPVMRTSSTHTVPRQDPAPPQPSHGETTTPSTASADRQQERASQETVGTVGAAQATDVDNDAETVTLIGAGFGGGLLTGLSLAALLHRRRRQFRYRRPGRAISTTPHELLSMERVVRGAGSAGIVDATWLDQSLRSLSQHLAHDPAGRLPDVIAVRMTHDLLELILTETAASPPPVPWTADDQGRRWSIRRSDDLGYLDQQRPYHFAPYPALVSVGYTVEGEQWLLDLERIGFCSLIGDRQRCLNLARFVAAELAHNTWSEELDVEMVGFGAEMTPLNPDRLRYATDPRAALDNLLGHQDAVRQVLASSHSDVLSGRLRNVDTDMLMPRVLLMAPDPLASHPDADDISQKLDRVRDQDIGRSAAAIVAVTEVEASRSDSSRQIASPGGWTMSVDAAGVLRVPALGLELIAQQASEHEAARLAQLLAAAANTTDTAMSAARGDQPWDTHADVAGAPLPHVTVPRWSMTSEIQAAPSAAPNLHLADPSTTPTSTSRSAAAMSQVSSVLPAPADTYVRSAATTEQDVAALAPGVSTKTRRQVEDADPTLDADLADWNDPDCPLPRLTLLGQVDVRAHGPLPEVRPRRAWNVEVVAYLACHHRGVTAEQLGTDLWPGDPDIAGKSKLRQAIYIARKWLGTNPRTGRDHLPAATPSPGGPALYRVEGLLVDAELFRRLRLRGVARGGEGIADLQAALDLVTGASFDQRRPGGYGWLADTPLDHEYTAMIVDVAHLVATHHLAAGDPASARAAAQTALNAGSTDDIALLDLVAACDAEGNRAEADRIVKRILANHDAEVEEDLPPRTAEVLHRRRWIGRAS